MPMQADKCAHGPCACLVANDERFCTEWCKEAEADAAETICGCGHPECSEEADGRQGTSFFREPMKDKRDRVIAALTVEAAMLELHAEQLSHRVSAALSLSER